MARTFRYSIFRKQLLLVLAALTSFIFSAAQNAIVTENALTGNPSSEWDISGAGDLTIQGFATDISVNKGQTVRFKIKTNASAYTINIYRLGYYNGNGARYKGTGVITAALPQTQPAPLTNSTTGLVDCGNWNESAHWDVPSTAVSGIYIAVLKRTDNGGASHIIFIVRDDASHSDLFFQTSDATWQAYNVYGGNSLYVGTTALPNGHASKVSYNRPFVTRDGGGGGGGGEDWIFNAEYPMIRFLEKNGYDVTYTTNIDAARSGSLILNHKAFLSVGHDEYWSAEQRANVAAARDAGVHLAFFSGNEVYWKTRWENSTDPSNTSYRTLVCYKEGTLGENVCGGKCDPSAQWTGLWRDGCQFPAAGACSPENALTGQISWQGSTGAIKVPSAYKNFRFWRNTSIATMGSGAIATLPIGTLGYEWDHEQYPDSYPHGRIILSSTTLLGKTHKLSLYRHSSGALVFGAGTVQWAWGLDETHDRGNEPVSADMQQATINLFADMGVQPSSIQPGRIASPQSTDYQAPVTTITSPAHNSSVPAYSPVTITGTTTDAFAVAGVEVSVDGGTTWQLATGTNSWVFSWVPQAPGTYTIKARGFDDSGNMEVPGVAGASNNITVTVTTGNLPCPCLTIFQPTDAPANQVSGQAIEIGVKFRTTQNGGYITGIRYYKNAASTGTRKGHLWNNYTGQMLAEATFTNETSSGWQQVLFDNPVAISTNTTYVASYYSSSGHYTSTYPYFNQGATVNGPLRALANGEDGVNAVFINSATPALPVNSFQSANYWVDVVYVLPDITPPVVSSVSPVNDATGVNINTPVTATFNEAIDAATITSSTFELRNSSNALVPATVSYNAGTKTATLTPTSALADMSQYTVTLKGGSSGIKDIAGYALVADYSWTFSTPFPAPAAPKDGKGGPILVISSSSNPFSRYAVEILRAEGLNEFDALDISAVNASVLNNYDVVVLGEMTVTAAQVTMFTNWTTAGGTFIAFKPSALLAPLLGITSAGTSLANKYLLVNTVSGPGVGIVNQTIQYHGSADLYTLTGGSGSTSLATLYSTATTATSNPAVTTRSVGSNGGMAIAFTYDLAKSIIYTRQGNPAWAGTSRDGQSEGPIRSDNLFFGLPANTGADWIDFNKIAIPQADEQQRLLANIIIQGNLHRKPLPRLWYLPKGLKAAIIMTGDDHANNGTEDRFNQYMTLGPNTPQDVANWTAIRGTSYIYPYTPISNTQASAFQALGFEIALHPNTDCTNYTLASLEDDFTTQLGTFYQTYPGLSPVVSNRTHCLPWSDWASQPKAEFNHGMRLDVNYYYWPGSWVQNRSGMFTGSGLPMRFADLDGTLIDVYQAPTQMTDESGITNMGNFCDQLLDKAIGAEGYYGTFCANMHTDVADHAGSNAIIASALARQIPVISAKQMLTWLDARNNTFFGPMTWSNNQLGFSVTAVVGANNLKAMLPLYSGTNQLISITRNGSSIPFTTQTIKGIQYAFFDVTIGYSTFVASYNGSPSVTTHPVSQTICAGSSISFSSAANGSPAPGVQWQVSTNGTVWTDISGATNSTLTFTATTGDNNKQYRAVWTNASASVNSNAAILTVNAIPSAPTVTVVNNCGSSVLTAAIYSGTLLWSNGATTSSITVTNAATYTVTQTVNGCTSVTGSGISAPKAIPSAPTVTVVNNCGNSVLTAGNYSGTLLWSNGATTSSITVTNAATYTVTQTVNGCTSATGSGVSAPIAIPSAPTVTVVNNCGSSVLTASAFTGTLLWSNGATTSSITVTNAATYTVTQAVNGCTSATGSGVSAPKAIPSAPTVTVVNNCGSSVLTASGFTGTLLWSNGATTSSITVTNAASYTVTQTVNGCTSATGSGISAPKAIPSAPTVTVVNNCGNSVLTAGSYSGTLLWSNGATTSSITVTNAATYTVTQTVNGCTSATGSGVSAPIAIPSAPTVTVVNNCGNTVLTASDYTGTLLWSNGATTSSITVTNAASYTVTQTVNGCTSATGNGVSAPIAIPSAPTVTVVNNCGSSVLTAGNYSGTLLWSNGATTSSITVTNAATYTVTQTVNGCTSATGSGVSAPIAIPSAPSVTVVNNCGSSVLTASGFTGSLLWSTGETTTSVTVTNAATHTVAQTVNGCTSSTGSIVAAPKTIPSAPAVTVADNCGNSVLTASGYTGTLLWSNGVTISSITVTNTAAYTVTQTLNGCVSSSGAGNSAPKAIPTAPSVSVVNNCGNSVLTAGNYTGTLLWSTGEETSSIAVSAAGTYSVTQVSSNGCSSIARSGTVSPRQFSQAPTITPKGPTTFCQGGSVKLASNAKSGNLWSNGATTQNIVVTTPGIYTVTFTGDNGCTSGNSIPVVVTVNPIPEAPTVTVADNCGNSVLTASNFTGALLWNNGSATSSITVSAPASYTVSQTINGCKSGSASGLAAPKQVPSAPTVTVANNCGSSLLTAHNYTGSLLWNTGETTASVTAIAGGTYTVSQTVDGCASPAGSGDAVPKVIPSAPVITPAGATTFCTGNAAALISDAVSNNQWHKDAVAISGETGINYTARTSGSYTVTTTSGGCTSAASSAMLVTVNALPIVSITNDNGLALNCTVPNTVLTAAGGASYLWSTGATTASITVSTAGTFTVTATGANGCTETSGATTTLDHTVPTASISNNNGLALNCTIPNTILTATGGTSYLWSTGATTASITVNTAGTFTVTVTGANGCTSTASATTTLDNTAPTASITNSNGLALNCTIPNTVLTATGGTSYLWSTGATTASIIVSTAGTFTVTVTGANGCTSTSGATTTLDHTVPTASISNNNGLALNCTIPNTVLTATGGTSYVWSTGATTASITVSTAGTFTVTVTGANGCTAITSATTTLDNTVPTASITNSNGLALNCTIPNTVLTATGGTSYSWSTGATTASITVSTAGTFTVTVTGANGCTATTSATTTLDNTAPTASITNSNGLALNCTIPNTVLTATGGTSYLWSTGATTASITVSAAGTFTVTVTGANGCTAITSATTTLDNTAPTASITNSNGLALNCTIPNTVLTATGGTSYVWSTGATTASITVSTAGTFTVTATGANGCTATAGATTTLDHTVPTASISNNNGLALNCTIPNTVLTATGGTSYSWSTGATTASITVSTAGTFTVTVTGANGCTATASATTTLDNTAPTASITNSNGLALNCTTQSTTLSATGGVSYLWSTGATTASITVSTAGTFTVTVTGANGCSATANATTTLDNTAPTASITNSNGLALNCTTQSTTLSATGGVSYLWSTGATTASITVSTAGTFTVTVTGANGCTSTASATTTLDNTAPTASITNSNGLALNCTTQSTTLSATGGVSYLWSTGATTASITVSTAGTFTVTVTGANGCTATASATTTLDNTAPTASITNSNGLALNCTTQSTTLSATGGVSYLWSTGATTASITVSTAGTFTVTVTGANGCSATANATTTLDNTAPAASITNSNGLALNCTVSNTVLTATGGTSYSWSTGATTASITVSAAGTFTVTVTGANGCTATANATTTLDHTVPTASITNSNGLALNCTVSNTVLTATGGVSYLWSTGATTASITVSAAGTFTVTVTGANGCTATTSATTTLDNTLPTITGTTAGSRCGTGTVIIGATASAGTINWYASATGGPSIGTGTSFTTPSIATTTSYWVDANNGCITAVRTEVIAVVNPLTAITTQPVGGAICSGSNINLSVIATGLNLHYQWKKDGTDIGTSVNTYSANSGGTYTVVVTGNCGVVTSDEAIVAINTTPPAPTITAGGPLTFCQGGSVTLTSSEATGNTWSTAATAQSINVNASGNYTVTYTAANGCTSASSTATVVTVNPLPALTSSTSLSVYSGDPLSYTAASSPGDATLTWTRAAVPGITNPAESGSGNISETLINNTQDPVAVVYVYTLTSSAGCISTENVTVMVNVPAPRIGTSVVVNAIQSAAPAIDMTIMPNPATDYFNLVVRNNTNNKTTINVRVLDIFGMVVEKHEKIAAGAAMRMGQTWAAGIYFIEVIQDSQRKVVKVIKAN